MATLAAGRSAEEMISPVTDARPGKAQELLSGQISSLQQLGLSELRAEWRRLFRTQTPSLSRDLIMRGVAYRMQELAHGGLAKAIQRKLASGASGLEADGQISVDPGRQIKTGARLIREWHGRTHVVTVTEDGFEYAGQTYPSLTKIAQAITGAHWSGPRFFGLIKTNSRPSHPPRVRRPAATSVGATEAFHGQA